MDAEQLTGRQVVVMGLGRFGGGIGVTRWLVEQGASVTVTDLADQSTLANSLRRLENVPITTHFGGHRDEDLDGCDLLVVNPAVNKDKSDFFQKAQAARIPWTSEMNLFFQRCTAPIIGITGTGGKSTTTAMLYEVLRHGSASGEAGYRKAWLGGNIGVSLLSELPNIQPEDWVILELSSFQLEDLGELRLSPHVALLTNLSENHLDRHGSMAAYLDAKLNIFRYQTKKDHAVFNPADHSLAEHIRRVLDGPTVHTFGLHTFELHDEALVEALAGVLRVPGRHNLENACAACVLARIVGLGQGTILAGLAQFRGLDHRLEFVAEVDGVRYYNDSKSTTPAATRLALQAFDRPVVLILGGSDKGASFAELGGTLAQSAKAVVCYGATRQNIADAVYAAKTTCRSPSVALVDSLEQAVHEAQLLAAVGDVVLLSPACASYDMFANYEERGSRFKKIVSRL